MAKPVSARYFRINPVELIIFSVVTLMCFNSVYHLFYDSQGFHPTALSPMEANPTSEGGNRMPASVTKAFVNLEVGCEPVVSQTIAAAKVRLNGPICGSVPGNDGNQLLKTQVTYGAGKYSATVFTDPTSNKYSTDYIPLAQGANQIHVEFVYAGGRMVARELTLNKN